MSSLGILLYGAAVTAIVLAALALIAWGIVNERRDRRHPQQGREVFGAQAASYVAHETARN